MGSVVFLLFRFTGNSFSYHSVRNNVGYGFAEMDNLGFMKWIITKGSWRGIDFLHIHNLFWEAPWPSGRAPDSRARGRGFDSRSGLHVVSLSKMHLLPKKYWLYPGSGGSVHMTENC